MDTKGGSGGGIKWVIRIDIYTLLCIKWITNKNLLYKKINKIKFKKEKKSISCIDSYEQILGTQTNADRRY